MILGIFNLQKGGNPPYSVAQAPLRLTATPASGRRTERIVSVSGAMPRKGGVS